MLPIAAAAAFAFATLDAEVARAPLVHASVDGPPVIVAKSPASLEGEGDAAFVPHCNGRGKVTVDGADKDSGGKGTLLLRLGSPAAAHRVRFEVKASAYEKRVACGEPARIGKLASTDRGLVTLRFPSPAKHADAGQVVVYVPKGHVFAAPGALLVGVHPWNGSPWTYAAYAELLDEADRKDVVLAMPSGLGNSLYTADAEDEVWRAIEAVENVVRVDPRRFSIWGASMGGAGATTIAFHRPDRFAFVASWFGDSRYDLTTYVRGILGGEAGAHQVNALDMLENARHLPVLLVHGDADRTSPIEQSTMLFDAMKKAGFDVTFHREPTMGHEGPLVVKHVREAVDRAAEARAPVYPARVSFRSVRERDTSAYGVTVVRSGKGDAVVDLEARADGVHVLRAEGVTEIVLAPGALDGADRIADAAGARVRFAR